MTTTPSSRSNLLAVHPGRLLCLALALVCSLADAGPELPSDHPLAPMAGIPDTVDVAAVFNNPARTLMLSDAGRAARGLLAAGGFFGQTEQAWGTLARTFGQDTDQTIRDLLGGRVAIVWDGLGARAGSPGALAGAIDRRWALMCEVDPAYLGRIRERLSPVKRTIAHGQPIYAVEKGRYALVLLDAASPRPATVLLAPRDGGPLLAKMLELIVDRTDSRGRRSIIDGREPMLASLPDDHGDPPAVAWVVRVQALRALAGVTSPQLGAEADSPAREIIAGLISFDASAVRVSFTSDIDPGEFRGAAPVQLLDSVAHDAVFAFASVRSPTVLIRPGVLSASLGVGGRPAVQDDGSHDLFAFPGLVMLSPLGPTDAPRDGGRRADVALSVLVRQPQDERQTGDGNAFALRVDRAMAERIGSLDPAQAPSYGGRFAEAVRTHRLHLDSGEAVPAADWPGPAPMLAWLSRTLGDDCFMIASLTPGHGDPAAQVRRISDAVIKLAAVSDAGNTDSQGVLARGFIRPARAVALFDEVSPVDLAISRFVETISIDLRRMPGGVRGSVSFDFARGGGAATLGGGSR